MNNRPVSDAVYAAIMRLLEVRTGLLFRPDQRQTTESGILRAMDRAKTKEIGAYSQLLATDRVALDDLIVELTVGETYFFRDPAQMNYIARVVVPEICARRGPNDVIRVWSAACASGEEPYSLAMLFDELNLLPCVNILGTDISRYALRRASDGLYRKWSLRDAGAARAQPYLTPDGEHYRVADRLRGHVRFEYLNLALDLYPSVATGTKDLDLILCRNVLIYFGRETVKAVARRLHDSLAEGGWLILAAGDPIIDDYAPFEMNVTEKGIAYRRRAAAPTRHSASKQLEPPKHVDRPTPQRTTAAGEVEQLSTLGDTGLRAQADQAQQARPKPASVKEQREHPIEAASQALVAGEYGRAIELTETRLSLPEACLIYIKALANVDVVEAETACREATSRHPTVAELYCLHGVLLLEQGKDQHAAEAIKRALFLDRSLVIAHFTLGSLMRRLGNVEAARRSFRNARNLAAELAADTILPLTDGERAGDIVQAADAQLRVLRNAVEARG
jgi:chemotaxis protein methyltransferase CheR